MKNIRFGKVRFAKRNSILLNAIFVLAGFSFMFASCKNVSAPDETENVAKLPEFELPLWPPQNASRENYPELVRWEVKYFNGEKICTSEISAAETKIDLPELANFVAPIAAQPITRHSEEELAFFLPAGCIYPFETKIAWEDGWTASVGISAAEQLIFGETLEIADKSDDDESGEKEPATVTIGTGDAAKILEQFNWEKYIATVREKMVEDEKGRKVSYNPWVNDCGQFGAYIKNLSNKASSKLSTSDRYLVAVQNVVDNMVIYRENVETAKTYETPKVWQFSKDKELFMKILERTKKLGVDRMPLSNFIPDQDALVTDEIVFLSYQRPAYFFVNDKEIISINHVSPTKNNLVIISPLDYNNMK